MLTQDTLELIVTSVVYIVLGMFLGNLILITLGIAPIIFLSIAVLIGQPIVTSVERVGKDIKVNVDDKVSDSIQVTIDGGPGIVTVSDTLPNSFALEEGNNFKAVWKGLRQKTIDLSYTALCAKRGYFDIRQVNYEVRHPLQVNANVLGVLNAKRAIIVQPHPLFVRKIKNHKSVSRIPMPMDARFRFGIPTTDFKEIRDYGPGDNFRDINWKASAKHLSVMNPKFLVNDYEKEGKKVVWIFLDSATHMALGTTVNNTMEYAIRAALGFTNFYIERDCRVGFCVYNHDASQWEGPFTDPHKKPLDLELPGIEQMETEVYIPEAEDQTKVPSKQRSSTRVLYPDVGKRQQYKITREMLHVEIKYSSESLKEAIHSCRKYIVGTQPLFVVISMIEAARIQGIIEGIKELHKYRGRVGGRPNIIMFNVQGYNVAAQSDEEKIAAGFLTYHTKPYYEFLRGLGVTVLNWDPIEESFASALQRQRVSG
jgi:uncharacterized protein (DUF58 family)